MKNSRCPTSRMILILWIVWVLGCNTAHNTGQQSTPNTSAPTPGERIDITPGAIAGRSSEKDSVGDVRNGNYQKPDTKLLGIDLTATSIEANGPDLKITFTASSDFPSITPSGQSAVWVVNACTPDGEKCCMIGSKLTGGERVTYTFANSRNTYTGNSTIKGRELVVTLPQAGLPDWMRKPFKWSANSEWDGQWKDRIPDEGEDFMNSPTVKFPK